LHSVGQRFEPAILHFPKVGLKMDVFKFFLDKVFGVW
jgi:hypothetical protein